MYSCGAPFPCVFLTVSEPEVGVYQAQGRKEEFELFCPKWRGPGFRNKIADCFISPGKPEDLSPTALNFRALSTAAGALLTGASLFIALFCGSVSTLECSHLFHCSVFVLLLFLCVCMHLFIFMTGN